MKVYFIKTVADPPMVKIGRSANPRERLAQLQTGSPYDLVLLGVINCRSDKHSQQVESDAHIGFKKERVRGEWFRYTREVRDYIEQLIKHNVTNVAGEVGEMRINRWLGGVRERKEGKRAVRIHEAFEQEAIENCSALDREFKSIVG